MRPSIQLLCLAVRTGLAPNEDGEGTGADRIRYLDHSIYQSDGLCHDFCNEQEYALAIVQSEYCWCSNYVPDSDDQVSVSNCQESCPGFPDDVCGGDGTFGYMTLDSSPSGTAGSSSEATSTTAGPVSTSLFQITHTDSTLLFPPATLSTSLRMTWGEHIF